MVVALIVLFVVAITLLIKKLLISNKKNSNQLDIENRLDRVEDKLNSMNKGK
ncbi:DUF4083 family protein [Peribacillus sp. R9-11]|uniref:DUF4083 family protein n=1 Tax=Peribacillus sp. R9-11 TaxID=3073271 RepID=UPI0037C8443A